MLVDDLRVIDFFPPCHLSYKASGFTLVELSPTERVSLRWTHDYVSIGLKRLFRYSNLAERGEVDVCLT